jgi:two-component system sensor histidine kinase/response regulator
VRDLEALKPTVRARVMAAYRRDAPAVMCAIEAAVEASDAAGVRDGAHRLKSSSAAIGATKLSELYDELERMGRFAKLDAARVALPGVRNELARVLARLSGVGAG